MFRLSQDSLNRSYLFESVISESMGSYQVDPVTPFKLDEIFRVYRAFFADQFATDFLKILMLSSSRFPLNKRVKFFDKVSFFDTSKINTI